jgi:hypothetical protein
MNLDKQDCIESIVHTLDRASTWRKTLIVKFPKDAGNLRAVAMLDQLAVDAAGKTNEQFGRLKNHFGWASGVWRDGLCEVARQIGFSRRSKDFDSFVDAVVALVSSPSVAA